MSGFLNLPDGHPAMLAAAETGGKQAKVDPEEEKKKRFSFASFSSEETSGGSDSFVPYYCFACGSFAMALEVRMHTLPRRKTDAAFVIDGKRPFKHKLKEGECKSIKREGGVEKQFRWVCSCGVPVCYQSTEFSAETPYIYIIDSAVSLNPSMVSLYWRDQGKRLPACVKGQEGEDDEKGKSFVVIPIEIVPESKRFNIKKLEGKMTLEVASTVVGGDMKDANHEAVKSVTKVLGLSSKQVKLDSAAGCLRIFGISCSDALRRLVCSMI